MNRRDRVADQSGFVTPIGWMYLILLLVMIVVVVSVFAWLIASANVTIAESVAEIGATRGAGLGLEFLITGTLPGSPIPIIALPEPNRTDAVATFVMEQGFPGGALAKYLAPLQSGDVVVIVSPMAPVSASVQVTARAGRLGQFVRTVTRVAAVRAANQVEAGRLLDSGDGRAPLASGVLPLAVDVAAFEGHLLDRTSRGQMSGGPAKGFREHPDGRSSVARMLPVAFGTTAFAVAHLGDDLDGSEVDSLEANAELLIAAAGFLGYGGSGKPRGIAPPGFSVGQRVVLATFKEGSAASGEELEQADEEVVHSAELVRVLLENLEGRAVIVPLVKERVIQGFAVATLQRGGASGLALDFLPSVLSPLAHVEPTTTAVSERLSGGGGLAMGLLAFGDEVDVHEETVVGARMEIAG